MALAHATAAAARSNAENMLVGDCGDFIFGWVGVGVGGGRVDTVSSNFVVYVCVCLFACGGRLGGGRLLWVCQVDNCVLCIASEVR